jgi:hypothetical protein
MKAETSTPATRRKAQYYLWYLELPFNDPQSPHSFDRGHWWNTTPKDVFHDNSLYELLRRHPKSGERNRERLCVIQKCHDSPNTPHFGKELVLKGPNPLVLTLENPGLDYVINQMLFYSLRPWTRLSKDERANFQKSLRTAYPGKGRDLTKGVFDLTQLAHEAAELEKNVGGPSFEEFISQIATGYASDGRLILATDTEFASKKDAKMALKQISEVFWKYWRKPTRLVRAHESDWLKAISDFEREFDLKGHSQIKSGYSVKFKKFIAHFDDPDLSFRRAWWRKHGRSEWAADLKSAQSTSPA